jgi:rhamnose utilization protein RhaD (predicted bifunctional aldolase and dehydrogenase)
LAPERGPAPEQEGLVAALVELSRDFGSRPHMVLAGGGNTSVKFDDHLLVKASGKALAEVTADDFVDLDRASLQALLESDLPTARDAREEAFKQAVLSARRAPAKKQRPSVESLLHHLMPGRFVVHLHATLANQFTCCRRGRELVSRLDDDVVWTDLVDPGFALARELSKALRSFQARAGRDQPRAVMMENHGLVASGDTPGEVWGHIDWLFTRLDAIQSEFPPVAPGPSAVPARGADGLAGTVARALGDALAAGGVAVHVVFERSDLVTRLVGSPGGRQRAMGGPLTPDQIVYCRSFPLWFEPGNGESGTDLGRRLEGEVRAYTRRFEVSPVVVLVPGLGLFACGSSAKEAATAATVYLDALDVMAGAERMGGTRYLDADFRAFIEHWEVESYRRAVAGAS